MDTCDEGELQGTMCDRSVNPTLQDVSTLYSQWRLTEYGSDRNGKELAESLIEEISLLLVEERSMYKFMKLKIQTKRTVILRVNHLNQKRKKRAIPHC